MNGILVVNKPPGMTSHQVIGRARRLLGLFADAEQVEQVAGA